MKNLSGRKSLLKNQSILLIDKHGNGTAVLELKDQYYNMKEKILPVMHLIDTAKTAIEHA